MKENYKEIHFFGDKCYPVSTNLQLSEVTGADPEILKGGTRCCSKKNIVRARLEKTGGSKGSYIHVLRILKMCILKIMLRLATSQTLFWTQGKVRESFRSLN